MDYLNICHDREAAGIPILVLLGFTDLRVSTQLLFPWVFVVPLLRFIFGVLIS